MDSLLQGADLVDDAPPRLFAYNVLKSALRGYRFFPAAGRCGPGNRLYRHRPALKKIASHPILVYILKAIHDMNRREFLKTLGAAALALAARRLLAQPSSPAGPGAGRGPSPAPQAADVGIVRGGTVEAAVTRAVELVGGIQRFVRPGDVVVVKPNIAWNSPPELRADTDPQVVRAVVGLCFLARASKVYVFDRTTSNPRLSYITSGIARAAEEAGARVLYVDEVDGKLYKKIPIPGASVLKETLVNRHILESDVLINVPVAKHHSTAGLTIGMKNLMGATGDNRSRWHWTIHESISDFSLAVRSHLTVVDARAIMVRNGPTGGSRDFLRNTDTIIASGNVVQADAEAAGLFGIDPREIGYLELARRKGIGTLSGYSRREASLG